MGEQHRAAVAGRPARLLVGEDAVEHVVAPDRHPGGRDVRRDGQSHEQSQAHRPAAAGGIDDREEPQAEQRQIDREHRRDEPAVDRLELRPLDDDQQADEEEGGETQEHEAATLRAQVQLARPGHEHREDAGREPAACRWEHHTSVGAAHAGAGPELADYAARGRT